MKRTSNEEISLIARTSNKLPCIETDIMPTQPRVKLATCDENSAHGLIIESLFQSEWSDFKFSNTHISTDASTNEHTRLHTQTHHHTNTTKLPPVIVALVDGQVIGGLAYSRYQEPLTNDEVVWFNALFVRPEWRGKGIASQLINLGVEQVSSEIQSRLYAYTNVPSLYASLGWSVADIESEPNHKVMSIALGADRPSPTAP